MTPTEYEKAVLERFRIDWPSPRFDIRHNVQLFGTKTRRARQVDVAVYERGEATPFLLAEAKMHSRAIDANKAGSTIALVQDVGGIPTIMVSTAGFSIAARNHLSAEEIGYLKLTLTDARGLRWLPELEKRFAVDREFKRISGAFVEALRMGDAEPFQDEAVPYEEWLAIIQTGLSHFPQTTIDILCTVAMEHYSDAYRFNAVQILSEAQSLDRSVLQHWLAGETDPDTIELIQECLANIMEMGEEGSVHFHGNASEEPS